MFKLPDLPYGYDALQPTISSETMRLHHDKHHAKYVDTVNKICADEGLAPDSLEALIQQARTDRKAKLFNNAAQAWNHAFFWSCMTPDARAPEGELSTRIGKAFGDLASLKEKFVTKGEGHFGSGWVWLLTGPEGLTVRTTHDGDDLVAQAGITPLITCDLWEHAYYVDYRNDRKAFLSAWFDKVADWSFAAHQLAAADGSGEIWRHPAPGADAGLRRQA